MMYNLNNLSNMKKEKKLIDITSEPVLSMLDLLLKDKTTKQNITWATDTYKEYGKGFINREQINKKLLLKHPDLIRPRVLKSKEVQRARQRKKAEVFTPAWLCNKMINYRDADWFQRKDVFTIENPDNTWTTIQGTVTFPNGEKWEKYVDSKCIEVTCGEAPFLVSRYDAATGERIDPIGRRVGVLDRKLRIVNENVKTYDEWLKWTTRAFEATYGYEYQGDSLLIARINLLLTFCDYYKDRWKEEPDKKILRKITNRIVWNVWQMDGLKDTIPHGHLFKEYEQLSFDSLSNDKEEDSQDVVYCRIYDWRANHSLFFKNAKAKIDD